MSRKSDFVPKEVVLVTLHLQFSKFHGYISKMKTKICNNSCIAAILTCVFVTMGLSTVAGRRSLNGRGRALSYELCTFFSFLFSNI